MWNIFTLNTLEISECVKCDINMFLKSWIRSCINVFFKIFSTCFTNPHLVFTWIKSIDFSHSWIVIQKFQVYCDLRNLVK
jgi:hypothetical protein